MDYRVLEKFRKGTVLLFQEEVRFLVTETLPATNTLQSCCFGTI